MSETNGFKISLSMFKNNVEGFLFKEFENRELVSRGKAYHSIKAPAKGDESISGASFVTMEDVKDDKGVATKELLCKFNFAITGEDGSKIYYNGSMTQNKRKLNASDADRAKEKFADWPDYTGTVKTKGAAYEIKGWKKIVQSGASAGSEYISCVCEEPPKPQQAPAQSQA